MNVKIDRLLFNCLQLAELLVPNMGQTVDPAMMGALMSACSLINAGAGTEEVRDSYAD